MSNNFEADCSNKEYVNAGNKPLLQFLEGSSYSRVLDVGCGAGDNARLIRQRNPKAEIHGITLSESEKQDSKDGIDSCYVFNVENGVPEAIAKNTYDVIIFSHVLEHLSNPAKIASEYFKLLAPGGCMIVAIPNVLVYNQRLQFLRGRFEYTRTGTMDMTHLRFFTWYTAEKYITADIDEPVTVSKKVDGAVPVWVARKILPKGILKFLDGTGCRLFPNLFGFQILLKIQKSIGS